MTISRFYYCRTDKGSERAFVGSMGIHETMAPGIISHGGAGFPFLFMFFHDAASVYSGNVATEAGGGMIIWGPDAWHEYGNPSRLWDHSWMIACGTAINHAVARHRLPLNRPIFVNAEDVFVRYLRMFYHELRKHQQQDDFMLSELFGLWIYEMSRCCNTDQEQIPANIMAARDLMEEKFGRPLTLPEVARVAGLSVPRFVVLFKRFFGEPPVRYLIRTRLERAAQMLKYRHLSVKQVAEETGFSDQLYFSRQFRAFFGQSPREFREHY